MGLFKFTLQSEYEEDDFFKDAVKSSYLFNLEESSMNKKYNFSQKNMLLWKT